MNIQVPFTFASVYPLGAWRSLGLRLHGLRQFQAFLASSPCAASASSSAFRSSWPVRSLSFLRLVQPSKLETQCWFKLLFWLGF